ncbi:MAG: hypothetical protein JF616_09080 [Fibrobacteres bacterium]|nr:hypothetical protein [Fibrobacterota bacterium]
MALACSTLMLCCGCGSSTETMQKKLEKIGAADLQDIVSEIPSQARAAKLARPFFKIDSYQEFHGDTAIVFQAMATMYFFYLDPSLDLCQMRKYRYQRTAGMWDRYEVKLVHFPSQFSGIQGE